MGCSRAAEFRVVWSTLCWMDCNVVSDKCTGCLYAYIIVIHEMNCLLTHTTGLQMGIYILGCIYLKSVL